MTRVIDDHELAQAGLALDKYFEAIITLRLDGERLPVSRSLSHYKLNPDHLQIILKVIAWRASSHASKYKDKEQEAEELEMLYRTFMEGIEQPNIMDNQVTEIRVRFKRRRDFVLKSQILIANLLQVAWTYGKPMLEQVFHEYVKVRYASQKPQRKKGASTGKPRAIKSLIHRIFQYLNNETNLNKQEIGNCILEMFACVGHNLEYTNGKNLIDTIQRSTKRQESK